MNRNSKIMGYGVLSGFVILLYTALYVISEKVDYDILGNNFNMVSYAGMLILIGVVIAVILWFFSIRIKKSSDQIQSSDQKTALDKVMAGLIILCGIVFLYLIYTFENGIYPSGSASGYLRSSVSKPVYALFMGALFALFFLFCENSREISAKKRIPVICFAALLCAMKAYAPNPFLSSAHDAYHMHAYANSIIHVANLHPFDWNTLSVYGHYGLLYLPLVKLLGNNYTAVALSVSVFTFITFYCIFGVCNDWIKKNSVFLLAVFAICGIPFMFYGGEYFQVNPQRLLFPAVTLFLISKIILRNIRGFKMWLLESVTGVLSLIWNMETGVFSIAVFCAFNLFMRIRESVSFRNVVIVLLKDLAFVLASVLGAYLILNLYSFLAGADKWMSFKRVIYPLDSLGGQGSYKITDLHTGLVTPFSIYGLQLILFSVVLLNACYALFYKREKRSYGASRAMLFCTALSGLSSVIYFVNRAAYANITISWIQMVLSLGIFADEGLSELRKIKTKTEPVPFMSRTAGKMVALFYVFVLAVEGGIRFEPYIRGQISGYWDMEKFNQAVSVCEQKLPKNVLAIGRGVPELLYQSGRNDFPALIDWSDMDSINYQKATELVDESVSRKEPVWIGVAPGLDEYIKEQGYIELWNLEVGNTTFRLMGPDEEIR